MGEINPIKLKFHYFPSRSINFLNAGFMPEN